MSGRILIIEDEEKIARFIELELGYEGYVTDKAFDGRKGLEMAEAGGFDLILLDIMLPQLSGMEVLRRIRRTSAIPIIMLTARDSVMDKVFGLDSGATDYITKPFAIEELLARIRNALRKNIREEVEVLSASGLVMDTGSHTVTVMGMPIDLTKREFDLLYFLLKNKGIVVSRDTLLEKVWGFDFSGETNSVDVYVRFLRGKIDEVFNVKLIHTVRGVGYVIKDEK
jgi:two-component system response regulator ArlR